jgi:hypothetical protein
MYSKEKMYSGNMVNNMQSQMKEKMARGGYMHGGKAMKRKADISAMEKACSSKAGKNNSINY